MSWAMELSPGGFDAMLADLSYMDRKTGRAYLQLLGYLRRFGSVPSSERALASVLGVTVRYFRDVAWPLLEDRLVLSEDRKRFTDPDISAANPRRAAAAPFAQEKSQQQQEAAKKRWEADKERKRQEAEAHAKPHEDRMRSDAEAHTNSMRGASETHAETDASASPAASGASPRAPASPPPPKQDSFLQPARKKESSGGGGTRADAGDGMRPHAEAHASTHKNHAQTYAEPHAPGTRPIRPSVRPIPPDWQPSPTCRAEADRLLGVTAVDVEITKFVLNNRGDGHTAADWDARFLVWCHRQVEWAKRHPQVEAPIVIPGGKAAEPEPEEEPIIGTGVDAQWARVRQAIGKGISRNWLGKAEIVGIEDGELTITLPTPFIRDHVEKNYGAQLATLWIKQNPEVRRVKLEVATAERRAAGD